MFTTWKQSHSYPLKSTCCGLRSLPFTTKHIRYSFGKPTLRHLSKQYISTLPIHITTSIDLHDVAHWKLRGCCVFCGSLDDQTQITCSNIHLLTAVVCLAGETHNEVESGDVRFPTARGSCSVITHDTKAHGEHLSVSSTTFLVHQIISSLCQMMSAHAPRKQGVFPPG